MENEKHLSIFYCKNRCTYKFYVLAIKSALRNISESSKFRFENSFNALSLVLNQYRLNLLQPSICITIVEIYIRKFIQTCPCFFNRYVPLNVSLLILFRFVCIPETLISKWNSRRIKSKDKAIIVVFIKFLHLNPLAQVFLY